MNCAPFRNIFCYDNPSFLVYHDGYLRIPNQELMKEFEHVLAIAI